MARLRHLRGVALSGWLSPLLSNLRMPNASKGGHAVQRHALQTTAGALDRDLANAQMST